MRLSSAAAAFVNAVESGWSFSDPNNHLLLTECQSPPPPPPICTVCTACFQACRLCAHCLQSILVAGKPHLGTDRLIKILQAFRKHLMALGVKIHFGTCAAGLAVQHDKIIGVQLTGIMQRKSACSGKVFLVLASAVCSHWVACATGLCTVHTATSVAVAPCAVPV